MKKWWPKPVFGRPAAILRWNSSMKAEDILGKLNTNGIPRKNLNQYAAVYADYLVKNKQYEEAVPYFKTAIKAERTGASVPG